MIASEEPITLMFANSRVSCLIGLLSVALCWVCSSHSLLASERPNILFAIADDWGWHAGAYGDPVVSTKTFDQLAKDGVLFTRAFVSSPSCTPSRAAITTGQYHWRLEESANLYGPLRSRFPLYTDLLAEAGYHVGFTRKGWGPGDVRAGGRTQNPAGKRFRDFKQFLDERPVDAPFCFWFGSSDPHRGYELGSGAASGIPLDKIRVPACFPDSPEVRGDVADYFFEVQRFDREVGQLLEMLKQHGLDKNTIVVMTGDHGMPFPRCKGNLYDMGAQVPLVMSFPQRFEGGRTVDDFVSLTDLAPTFLEIAGIDVPQVMTGRSLLGRLAGESTYVPRPHVLIGKERHVPSQEAPDSGGTPMRAIRTDDFLYIKNLRPDRWPAGTPNYQKAFLRGCWYGDVDNGPTKNYMIDHRDKDEHHRALFEAAFGMRPARELYDLRLDPHQLKNVAGQNQYAEVEAQLEKQLMAELVEAKDPRAVGGGEKFDEYPYSGGAPRYPKDRVPKK